MVTRTSVLEQGPLSTHLDLWHKQSSAIHPRSIQSSPTPTTSIKGGLYAPDLRYKNSKIVATHRLTQTLYPVLPGVSPRRSQAGLYPEKHLKLFSGILPDTLVTGYTAKSSAKEVCVGEGRHRGLNTHLLKSSRPQL